MKCPYCPAQIAYLGEEHSCAYPELASGDPAGPDSFPGTDEGSHFMASRQGFAEFDAETCTHEYEDRRSAIVPSDDPDYHRCELCGDDGFQAVPDEELGKWRLKGLGYGITPEQTQRVMEKTGISKEDARSLRDEIFRQYPELKATLEPASKNWLEQHTEKLNRELSPVGTHVLKTWPKFFEAVYLGDKTFEVRKNDRDFHVGDTLVLREWDPETKEYSGRRIQVRVTYMMYGSEHTVIDEGYVVMAIKREDQ